MKRGIGLLRFLFAWASLSLLALLASPVGAAEDALNLYYFERAPLYQSQDGQAAGLLIELARGVLAEAGLTPRFQVLPPMRILAELKQGDEPACSPGWFYTAERAAWMRYTAPIYREPPYRVLMRRELSKRQAWSLAALLDAPTLVLGVNAGFSYGETLDRRIAARAGPVDRSINVERSLRLEHNLRKLQDQRIDFLLMSDEEWLHIYADRPEARGLVALRPADMPPGEFRYLVCTRRVPPAWVQRLDAAIAKRYPELLTAEREAGSPRLSDGRPVR